MDDQDPDFQDLRLITYLKRKFFSFWDGTENNRASKQTTEEETTVSDDFLNSESGLERSGIDDLTWKRTQKRVQVLYLCAFLLILLGQLQLELKRSSFPVFGILLLIAGGALFIFALKHGKGTFLEDKRTAETNSGRINWFAFLFSLALAGMAYLLFRNNGSGWFQVLIWIASMALLVASCWEMNLAKNRSDKTTAWKFSQLVLALKQRINKDKKFFIGLAAVILIVILFQIVFLRDMPLELISQQVETYLAVDEIRQGSMAVLFPRNEVIEPLGYYWLAFISCFFREGARLTAFYVAQAIGFAVGLVFLFFLARSLFNKWVGLLSVLIAGISFWPILQTYSLIGGGLVFPILCVSVYFLFRAMGGGKGIPYLWFGFLVGLGILTNKIFLILPVAGLLDAFVYWITKRKEVKLWKSVGKMALAFLTAVLVLLPMLAAVVSNPSIYFDPILSRVSNMEVPIEGFPLFVFLRNLLQTFGIFNWSNRGSWVDGIPNRGALDAVSAGLFFFGLIVVLWDAIHQKSAKKGAFLLLLPLFLIPSAMSLAFPLENPSLSRAYGAFVPGVILAGCGLYFLIKNLTCFRPVVFTGIVALCVFFMVISNAYLLNKVYKSDFRSHAWNTHEISQTVRTFKNKYGQDAQVWIVGHPYWVDERAVAILAEMPIESLKFDLAHENELCATDCTKMFILNEGATEPLSHLKALFPNGVESHFQSQQEGKNFVLYLVLEGK